MSASLGSFPLNEVTEGDCRKLTAELPDNSIDVGVTSPPYWGQRLSEGNGVEADPRAYVAELAEIFGGLLPKMKLPGCCGLTLETLTTPRLLAGWRTSPTAREDLTKPDSILKTQLTSSHDTNVRRLLTKPSHG